MDPHIERLEGAKPSSLESLLAGTSSTSSHLPSGTYFSTGRHVSPLTRGNKFRGLHYTNDVKNCRDLESKADNSSVNCRRSR